MSSRLKQVLKRLTPPILLDLIRPGGAPTAAPAGLTFTGVYRHLRDVPTHQGEFDERLIGRMVWWAREGLARVAAGKLPSTWHEPLAIVAGLVCRQQGRVRVLDFGGGIGPGFIQLTASLPDPRGVSYLVVDLEQTVAAARPVFAGDERISFATELPDAKERFDIVYANSVLQYVEDYRAMIERLAAYRAPYLLLGQLAVGEFETFATQQVNVPGQILPYWFLGKAEVVDILSAAGYSLVSEALMGAAYESDLPASHRAEQMRNMLFVLRSPKPARPVKEASK